VLRFPTEVEPSDALNNEHLAAAVRDWRQNFRASETRLFRWTTTRDL
jgi:hypothetical protein